MPYLPSRLQGQEIRKPQFPLLPLPYRPEYLPKRIGRPGLQYTGQAEAEQGSTPALKCPVGDRFEGSRFSNDRFSRTPPSPAATVTLLLILAGTRPRWSAAAFGPTSQEPMPQISVLSIAPTLGACYDPDMRVIAVRTLREFWAKHAQAEQPLRAWFKETKKAEWREPVDITGQYSNARTIGNDRAIFNIKGNDYRLVVAIRYDKGLVFIRFLGTHAEYDEIDALTV